ncbi:type IV secretory system conjugative DNA transfer family protein [Subsaximicrobium wynnwilliamsii]|uniref:Type IV secretory system conjugative DNA transfer family protein n=1 Tax=Subsaximicrobium wynnwilliamsii TaxID=291179 RepID=A0A5C6ZHR3_9FLAO|nr:type IV secretory system conjugative DNA transfer family protein [Subsaximicrobium wynnwilliamsii]TXD83427.1 type IV secretory system conjugative DNA transfer family protein [Subsaximicrobium wynnwilliamsii]TXD89298.1 type IV secretory system conjugative DNA transfer family protein [Subsaximicrobium wynnwilliamsii]TXE03107.1 type IV secretory system conjugative DNA transfer family protein [Subsaximicrobium wynnwilliamsii]
MDNFLNIFFVVGFTSTLFYGTFRVSRYAFIFNILILGLLLFYLSNESEVIPILLYLVCPLMLINIGLYVFLHKTEKPKTANAKYQVNFATTKGNFKLDNIKRGASVIGSAGSGKTESVVYGFLKHFQEQDFCGIIHDYKDFELTEMAYPLFKGGDIPFKVISFDKIIHRVNPIAPRYLENEESVNEVSRVLIENLLEQRESGSTGTTKFFNDAAEGLIGGLIWKLKTSYPQFCTLPHLIAIYQYLDTDSLIQFLESNITSRAMADAFISGKDSERQTAGVKSTLANALKRISTQRIFMALSADEVPLNINSPENPTVISVVNNPKFETSYSPVIATIIHTITKQMSVRKAKPSFLMMEEAPTIRLLNMHRIPATLRSYNISTIYVMQDKIQNDMMYGDKASKAILSNLSYQFFGKVNDPDTAKYYERFFEIVKDPTKSVSRGHNLDFDTRITTGEKEIPKIRADVFFRLKQGEFITYADGKDKRVQFKLQKIERELPKNYKEFSSAELEANFERIYHEAKSIFE